MAFQSFSERNPTLDYHITGYKRVSHSVQHSKLMCRVQALVCMFKLIGYDQSKKKGKDPLNFKNHRPIIIWNRIYPDHFSVVSGA